MSSETSPGAFPAEEAVLFRHVRPSDAEACALVENACFTPAEAASLNSIQTRIREWSQGFLVAEAQGSLAPDRPPLAAPGAPRLVAMINSGATGKDDITDEEFKALIGHDPTGRNMVVFSLAVHPAWRGLGLARQLMERFTHQSRALGKERILLLCKDYHIGMYERLGYAHLGESASRHGGFVWHEMGMELERLTKV